MRIERLLGEMPSTRNMPFDDALIQFVPAGVQAAEIAAEGDDDPDDIVVMRGKALLRAEGLVATFMGPTPPNPLEPLVPIWPFGADDQAIHHRGTLPAAIGKGLIIPWFRQRKLSSGIHFIP